MLLYSEMRSGERIQQVDRSKRSARPCLLHRRPDRANDLVHSEQMRRRCEMVEVDDVLLDFGTEQLIGQRAPGENDDVLECLMRLDETETLPAHEAGCTENHYRAGVRHTTMKLGWDGGYGLTDEG